jgi:dynein heavy chain
MGMHVPDAAALILAQEGRLKSHFAELSFMLTEYERIAESVIPVVRSLLKPALLHFEYRLVPGLTSLTWSSLNIEAFKASVHAGLSRLADLVHNINDLVENRIESQLRSILHTELVDLPTSRSLTLDDFVALQVAHVRVQSAALHARSVETEVAVRDLISMVCCYALDPHVSPPAAEECARLFAHYNSFTYNAILSTCRSSLNALKHRVTGRVASSFIFVNRPFFVSRPGLPQM